MKILWDATRCLIQSCLDFGPIRFHCGRCYPAWCHRNRNQETNKQQKLYYQTPGCIHTSQSLSARWTTSPNARCEVQKNTAGRRFIRALPPVITAPMNWFKTKRQVTRLKFNSPVRMRDFSSFPWGHHWRRTRKTTQGHSELILISVWGERERERGSS